ncbi:hypothetical protein RUND412_003496 [Rhizina undulata]
MTTIAQRGEMTPTQTNGIFQGMKFWLSHRVPQIKEYKKKIKINGGIIVAGERAADICLVDDRRDVFVSGMISFKYVDHSIAEGKRADLESFEVIPTRPSEGIRKQTRNKFTARDDRILMEWVNQPGTKDKGNAAYKQLSEKYPHHTWQSWRSRYVQVLAKPQSKVVEGVEDEIEDEIEDAEYSSGKGDKQPAVEPNQTEGFSTDDDKIILRNSDAIKEADDPSSIFQVIHERDDILQSSLTTDDNSSKYPHHSAEQWHARYREVLLPVKRRMEDLEIGSQMKASSSTAIATTTDETIDENTGEHTSEDTGEHVLESIEAGPSSPSPSPTKGWRAIRASTRPTPNRNPIPAKRTLSKTETEHPPASQSERGKRSTVSNASGSRSSRAETQSKENSAARWRVELSKSRKSSEIGVSSKTADIADEGEEESSEEEEMMEEEEGDEREEETASSATHDHGQKRKRGEQQLVVEILPTKVSSTTTSPARKRARPRDSVLPMEIPGTPESTTFGKSLGISHEHSPKEEAEEGEKDDTEEYKDQAGENTEDGEEETEEEEEEATRVTKGKQRPSLASRSTQDLYDSLPSPNNEIWQKEMSFDITLSGPPSASRPPPTAPASVASSSHPPGGLKAATSEEVKGVRAFLDHCMNTYAVTQHRTVWAIVRTSGVKQLVEEVLKSWSEGKGLPDMPGVWSEAEDEVLLGGDGRAIQEIEQKKGAKEVDERMEFLNLWHSR